MANPALAKTRRFDTVAVMFSLSASKCVNEAFAELGQITLLVREAAVSLLKGRPSWRDLLYQINFIGVKSQSVVVITAVKNIESSTEVLKSVLNDIQSGKGLAGTMLQNEQLSANVQAIANNLAIASSNLNQLGLWGLLWHHEPLRTNAPMALSHPEP